MFSWLLPKPECPVPPANRAWLDRRWAWLVSEFGVERLRSTRVILPRREDFPDRYSESTADARTMFDRVCGYMGIDPTQVELHFWQQDAGVGGAGRGATGLYLGAADRFHVALEAGNLANPMAMVATMAHELGHVHLLGHGRLSPDA